MQARWIQNQVRSLILGKTLDRGPYFWWGFALMAIKYNLDRAVAGFGFHHSWYFWNYIKPHGFAGIDTVPPDDQSFYIVLLLTSVPFLILGILLTLGRLRSAGLPLALCLLFFLPVINLIFFVILCLVPAKPAAPPRAEKLGLVAPKRSGDGWKSWLPSSAVGSAVASTITVGWSAWGSLISRLKCFATTAGAFLSHSHLRWVWSRFGFTPGPGRGASGVARS